MMPRLPQVALALISCHLDCRIFATLVATKAVMTGVGYAEKYGELDRLLRRYCDHKQRQTKSLERQLKEEVCINIKLRKYIAFFEGRLLAESENAKESGRLLHDKKGSERDTLVEHERRLHTLAAQLESRLRVVERREQKCAEFAAALKTMEQQYWADVNSFRKSKAVFDARLAASMKTVLAELQLSRDKEDALDKPLDYFPSTNKLIQMRGCDLGPMTRYTKEISLFGRDESAARGVLLADEQEERGSILGSFFRASATLLKRHLGEQQERDAQLKNAEDLLRLQEIDLACRMRNETDLQRDTCAHVETQRKVLEMQCKSVLRSIGDALESLPDLDVEAVMTELESRIQRALHLPSANVNIKDPSHKAARIP